MPLIAEEKEECAAEDEYCFMNTVLKKQDNENSPITTTDFLPQDIRKNAYNICHKLFLNIHP